MDELPEDNLPIPLRPISTGSIRLDLALGTGGLPRSQITGINGSSGKTSLCLHTVAQAQAQGALCAWIDADLSFNAEYAAACGVHLDQLYYIQTTIAEQALDIIDILARSGSFALIVLDSLSALVPQSEKRTPLGELAADRLNPILSQSLPALRNTIRQYHSLLLITRSAVPRGSKVYHDLAHNPTRLALALFASVRLELSAIVQASPENPIERLKIVIRINNYSPYINSIELDIIVNRGFNINGEILDLGKQFGLIRQQGEHYFYQNLLLGDNHEQVLQTLQNKPKVRSEIERSIRQGMLPAAA